MACSHHFAVPVPSPTPASGAPPIERATIAVPVTISTSALLTRLDSVFPPSDSLDRAKCSSLGGLVCHQYVYRRDSIDLRMVNDRISLFTRLRYRGRVALPGNLGVGSCGYDPEPMRRVEFRLATSLYWRADWRLASRATEFTSNILDPCPITVLRVDATPLMRRIVDGQLDHFKQQLDSIVPAVANLRPVADSIWRMVQRAVAVDSTSSAWFTMTPEAASLAPPVGTGAEIRTGLLVTGRPRIVLGSRPTSELRPLPALTLAGQQNGIHVPLEIELPFDDLSRKVTALLSGEGAGKGIRVGDIKVWGVGDTAVVKVGIDGRVTGSLFLVGRVAYDASTRSVLIPDLQYSLESANKMSSIKATLGAPRIRHALNEATGGGRLAVGDEIDRLKTVIAAQLNRELMPGVTLAGNVTDVRVDRLYTTSRAFVLRVIVDADARVSVR